MFKKLTIRGKAGAILCGYYPAATLRAWSIAKVEGQWTLTASLERQVPFMLRKKPLLFTAPRDGARDGFWAWGVESVSVGLHQVVAKLGPPEQ